MAGILALGTGQARVWDIRLPRSHSRAVNLSVRFLGRFARSVPVKTRLEQGHKSIDCITGARARRLQNQLGPMSGIQRHQIKDILRIDCLCPFPNSDIAFE